MIYCCLQCYYCSRESIWPEQGLSVSVYVEYLLLLLWRWWWLEGPRHSWFHYSQRRRRHNRSSGYVQTNFQPIIMSSWVEKLAKSENNFERGPSLYMSVRYNSQLAVCLSLLGALVSWTYVDASILFMFVINIEDTVGIQSTFCWNK